MYGLQITCSSMYRKQVTCSSMPQKLNAYQYPAVSRPQEMTVVAKTCLFCLIYVYILNMCIWNNEYLRAIWFGFFFIIWNTPIVKIKFLSIWIYSSHSSIVRACISVMYTCYLYVNAFDIIWTLFYPENTVLFTLCTTQKCNSVYTPCISKIPFRLSSVYVGNTIQYIFCICRIYDSVYHLFM
jgi:hypothetical protein